MIEVKQAPPKKIVQNNANLFEKLRIPPLVEYTAERRNSQFFEKICIILDYFL